MAAKSDSGKRQIIKKAARELFFHFGFTKTSMDDIAKQSDLAKPTLYYYYSNKEALFQEIVLEEAELFIDQVVESIPKDLTADKQLGMFFQTMHAGLKQHVKEMETMPEYLCEHSPHGEPIEEHLNELMKQKILPILQKGQESDIFQIKDLDTCAEALVYMTEFLSLDWIKNIPRKKQDKIVSESIEIMITGITRRGL